jgi:mannose/fructose/N-acetylgalactosamine-specific phosphotransferase system component IIC
MSPQAGLLAAAAAASLIELDASAAGQFMIGRPIVLGPVLGAALGQLGLGAGLGILCELLSLEDLPVGGKLPLNATVAISAALILALGRSPVTPELALPVGLAAGWGHGRWDGFVRRRRAALNAAVESRLGAGLAPRLGALAAGQLLKQAAGTFALLLAVLLGRGALHRCELAAPVALQSGLRFGLAISPWPALWSLMRSFKVLS